MQPVLERGSIDKPLTFDIGLIQHSFIQSVHLTHATFQSNCAEGLHFSAFHYYYNKLNSCNILTAKFSSPKPSGEFGEHFFRVKIPAIRYIVFELFYKISKVHEELCCINILYILCYKHYLARQN